MIIGNYKSKSYGLLGKVPKLVEVLFENETLIEHFAFYNKFHGAAKDYAVDVQRKLEKKIKKR